jgi:hypothetical protein
MIIILKIIQNLININNIIKIKVFINNNNN